MHYLALLERKPGGLDYARPLEQWDLPACFPLLRCRLEAADPDSIRVIAEHRAERPVAFFSLKGRPTLQAVRVETTDVSAYSALLIGSGSNSLDR